VWALAHQKCTIDGAEKMGRNGGYGRGRGRGWEAAERTEIPFIFAEQERERVSNCVTIVLEQN